MKYRFIIDCVIGEREFAAGAVHELDGEAAAIAVALQRAVPAAEAQAEPALDV